MEKMKYKISSRATILLGRESVSKVESALIELIKNTYDADATMCYILFDVENDSILLIDDGSGMTKKIIEDNWMMIGTDNKKKEYISKKKRIKSGEKGIGRFALDRLGGVCELFTKSQEEHATIRWKTNWNSFEEEGNLLEDIEAEFEYVSLSLYELIPDTVKNKIIQLEHRIEKEIDFSTGTIIKISNLRDEWTNNQIERIKKSMEFLIPPKEQDEFYICQQKSIDSGYELIENNFSDEFDYKIKSVFDGENFMINLYRNEFDVDKIPENVFREERFMRYPYRKEDFKAKCLEFTYSISQLFNTSDSEYIERIIENDNKMLIERNLNDLYKNDQFLKSWITVVTNQSKKDKRKRLKKNIYDTIEKIVNVLQPILVQKKVQVELIKDEQNAERRIFESDFESIFYNLIINSIEAFSKSSTKNRKIRIELKTNENLVVNYLDNGDGLDNKFKNPYEIFTLGSTSKYDQFGNVIGTGLGMYIIASTLREYNGDYKLTQIQNGFGLEIRIPL